MLTLILASLALVAPSDEFVVFEHDGHHKVVAPDAVAARFAIARFAQVDNAFYRVEPLADGRTRIERSAGVSRQNTRISDDLWGEQSEGEIRVPKGIVERETDKRPPTAEQTNEGFAVWADQDSVHDVLFAIMTAASRPYQVGPQVYGNRELTITIYFRSPSLEAIVGTVLRQVDGLFVVDGNELIVLDAKNAMRRKSVGYRAIDTILGSIRAPSWPDSADDVVFLQDRGEVIAPDETAARYAIARLRELKKGFYRVEPMDDGTFKLNYSDNALFNSHSAARILKGKWRPSEIRVPRDVVDAAVNQSSIVVETIGGRLSLSARSEDVHDVLFFLMKKARRPYQVGPRTHGTIIWSVVGLTVETIMGGIAIQVGSLLLVEGNELIVMRDDGVINRRSSSYRGSDGADSHWEAETAMPPDP